MPRILEVAPVFAEEVSLEYHHINGIWNSREQTEALAVSRGHEYVRFPDGPVATKELTTQWHQADALIVAPTPTTARGMLALAEGHGEVRARTFGHSLLDRVSDARPDLPIVLISHFLVGHGQTHRNGKANTWALRALEAHLRRGRNPWTILRPTWLSTIHDDSYQTRLTPDPQADGLVSRDAIAAAVVTAIEAPEESQGTTSVVFNLSIPTVGETDLRAEFAAIPRDFEALAQVSVLA